MLRYLSGGWAASAGILLRRRSARQNALPAGTHTRRHPESDQEQNPTQASAARACPRPVGHDGHRLKSLEISWAQVMPDEPAIEAGEAIQPVASVAGAHPAPAELDARIHAGPP